MGHVKLAIGFLLAIAVVASARGFAEPKVDRLTPEHRKWLDEEVTYVITDRERDVFLSLGTVEERNRFIEVFWERRDPDRATPVNEFKEEHYRRLDYANRILGRDAPRPGYKTDRGKYYIILGKPQEIQRYDGSNEVVSSELWLYQGDSRLGLPPKFNLLFFKENDIGEYKLYHPFANGPEALLRAGVYYRAEQNRAIDVLEVVSPDLARASLTIDMTEPVGSFLAGRNTRQPITSYVRPSMAVDSNLASIAEAPLKRVNTEYIDGYLNYKDKVSADYSFRFVPSRQIFTVLYGPQDVPFVHFAVEMSPENFTLLVNEDRTKYYTTLDVSLEVKDRAGNLVAVQETSPYVELKGSEIGRVSAAPFAYHDDLPLLPGDYTLSLVLRNRATKEFTAAERELRVEQVPTGAGLSPLVVGYKKEIAGGKDAHRAFQVGSEILYPAADGAFVTGETVHVLLQVPNATPDHRLRWTFRREQEAPVTREVRVGAYGAQERSAAIEEFSLEGAPGGIYSVRAELLDPSGTLVQERALELTVSPRSSLARPGFVYRHSFNTDSPGLLSLAVGQQFLALGQLEEATAALTDAVGARNPRLAVASWKLASVHLLSGKADEALALLLPLKDEYKDQPEVVEGLGLGFYLKSDFRNAVSYLERAVALRPPDTSLLNALGDSYQQLGEKAKAKEAFERSLQLNPTQQAVVDRLASFARKP